MKLTRITGLAAGSMALVLVAMFVLSYLTSLAGQIYKGALYLYASSGVVPEPYNQEMLDSAWKFKKS